LVVASSWSSASGISGDCGRWKHRKILIDRALDKLIFTGSVPTGKRVAEAAATRLLPVALN
jgi:acyl-CoA reductase-like NAD-dependent aldehyde dehydrogenase